MAADVGELRVQACAGGWVLVGEGASEVELVNDFLGYLADRNYSRQTVRAYAFDLLHFARWLSAERLTLERVDTDALLRYLAACRTAVLPHQRGGNVYSIRDGRNIGYARRTVNRRLAALSALFAFRGLRNPEAMNPPPGGREARETVRGERSGLLCHLATPAPRSRLRLREPRRLLRGLDNLEVAALLASLEACATERSRA